VSFRRFVRRTFGQLFAPHPRVVALREQAEAASSYANHVLMMKRCVDELYRDVCVKHAEVMRLHAQLEGRQPRRSAARVESAYLEARDAIEEFRTQKAELDAMLATRAQQETRFALNKASLTEDGFDVSGIVLSLPDVERAEFEADSLIASFELDRDLRSTPLH
jgi:hypothetical protein